MTDPIVKALGLRDDTPAWYARLALAVKHADYFDVVVKRGDDAELQRWAWTFDQAQRADAHGFDFVDPDMHADFLEIVESLERTCDEEAARRGIKLLPWPGITAGRVY